MATVKQIVDKLTARLALRAGDLADEVESYLKEPTEARRQNMRSAVVQYRDAETLLAESEA